MTQNYIVLSDFINNGFKPEFLDLVSLIALFFGTTVIIIKNPIGSLICLIGLFGAISVYLIMIDDFPTDESPIIISLIGPRLFSISSKFSLCI